MKVAQHVSNLRSSYIREILDCMTQSDCISLAGGLPSPRSFPVELFKDGLEKIKMDHSVLQYSSTRGDNALLEVVTDRFDVSQDRSVIITAGSQQGIDMVARTFVTPETKVVLEQPSYLGALQAFSLQQASLCCVTQQSDGPDLDQLEVIFRDNQTSFFYGVPDFQNPTGVCWSLEKRIAVCELCQQYGVLFIEDAPYRELRFSGVQLPMMSELMPDHTIELRSFSKVLAPGLRLSALITPSTWLPSLLKVKQASDLHCCVISQRLAAEVLMDARLPEKSEQVLSLYRYQYSAMACDLASLQTLGCNFNPVAGGMFIWLELPSYCDVVNLARATMDTGIVVVPSSEFCVAGESTKALRLNFTYNSAEVNSTGISLLKPVIEKYVSSP